MNETRIEWTDKTLNPVVGCANGCSYCYARGQAKRQRANCDLCYRFIPHPHLERLAQLKPSQEPKRIFITSMWDWNGPGVKREWLDQIIERMRMCPQHTFQVLSKVPSGYRRFEFPSNAWIGTSITTDLYGWRVAELLSGNTGNMKFVSIEPIHGPITVSLKGLDWIIVGAESGRRRGKVIPERCWIAGVIDAARRNGTPVFVKDNVQWHERIQEYPTLAALRGGDEEWR